MIAFYPGAEPECDGCRHQNKESFEECLWCMRFDCTIIYYYPKCMRERKESQDD